MVPSSPLPSESPGGGERTRLSQIQMPGREGLRYPGRVPGGWDHFAVCVAKDRSDGDGGGARHARQGS